MKRTKAQHYVLAGRQRILTAKRSAARITAACCAVIVAAALLVNSLPAQATVTNWERDLISGTNNYITTNTDGSVTAAACSTGIATQNISSDNVVLSTVPVTSVPHLNCETVIKIGTDTTLYGTAYVDNFNQTYLAAYKDDTLVWSIVPPDTCANQIEIILALQLGADNNLYMISYRYAGCSGQEFFLSKINPADGSTMFSRSLGGSFGNIGGNASLMPYDNGLALLGGLPAHITYYDYQGNEMLPLLPINLETNEFPTNQAYTHQGRVYLLTYQNRSATPECPMTSPAHRVLAFDVHGVVLDGQGVPLQYSLPDCTAGASFKSLSGGGVVVGVFPNQADERWIALNSELAWMWEHIPNIGTIGERTYGLGVTVLTDTNNHVITQRYYTRNNQQYRGVEFRVLDAATGEDVAAPMYTDEIDPLSSFNIAAQSVATAPGRIYLGAYLCAGYSCSITDPPKLFAIRADGVGMDYPRGALFATTPPPAEPYSYVALGDSYSSGEGVPPFDINTDRPRRSGGVKNACHRSDLAYPNLLPAQTSQRLYLAGFYACSGAETKDIVSSAQYTTQPPQIDSLAALDDVDLVTLTIGGNDIGFGDFAASCAQGDDKKCEEAYRKAVQAVDNRLPANLDGVYKKIGENINQDGKVFVLGYPWLVTGTDSTSCAWFTAFEQDLAFDLTNKLNQKIEDSVAAIGDSRFSFVSASGVTSPFFGHDLCSGDSFFNEPMLPTVYSYHPNRNGQQAYADLVKRELIRLQLIPAY